MTTLQMIVIIIMTKAPPLSVSPSVSRKTPIRSDWNVPERNCYHMNCRCTEFRRCRIWPSVFLVNLATAPPSNIVVLLWKRKVCAPPPCFLALLYDSAGHMGNGAKCVQLSLNCGICFQELRVLHEEIRAYG
jgi:hypothetical protein